MFHQPNILPLDYQFITKDITQGTRVAEIDRARYVGGGGSSSRCTQKISKLHSLGGFMEASLHRHD